MRMTTVRRVLDEKGRKVRFIIRTPAAVQRTNGFSSVSRMPRVFRLAGIWIAAVTEHVRC